MFMKYKAVVEIPKGCDRRIHLSYDGVNFIDLGLIKKEIPINNGVMPVCYGYLENAINNIEKDNVDVIIFSNQSYKTKDKVTLDIIGMLSREDGDHKVIAIDDSFVIKNFNEIDEKERNLILEYFGYKSKITSIDDRDVTLKYLQSCLIKK